jgi:glutamate dehydrogenase/leucine dehydrogenase
VPQPKRSAALLQMVPYRDMQVSSSRTYSPASCRWQVSSDDALKIVEAGCKIVAEGANMPSDPEAIKIYHEKDIEFGPAKVLLCRQIVLTCKACDAVNTLHAPACDICKR